MLKKIFVFLFAATFWGTTANAQTAWQEGTHYEVIAEKASAKPQVREVFSFWCPHCFTFEPVVEQIKQKLPAGMSFSKAHVNFMGGVSRDTQDDATKAMLAAKAMKADKTFNAALFSAIHRDRKTITGMADIKQIFAAAGGDAEKLEKMTKSFGIKGQVSKNNQYTRGIPRVPAFIVNDKYKANFTRDMTPDVFVELILWLAKQP